MRTVYHEFESLEHILATRLLPGGGNEPIQFVVFGGTGAVGGASVMELCRMILTSKSLRQRPLQGEIHATGMTDKEVVKFIQRLYLALEDEFSIEKIEPRRHFRVDGRIDLKFSLLQLDIPQDLPEHVAKCQLADGKGFDLEQALDVYFAAQPCPFLNHIEGLDTSLLHAVVVAIPLPSVATYTLVAIDRLATEHDLDHLQTQRIKKSYLQTFIRGLAVIQQRHARHVVMAHTTAVGGMYRVDGGRAEIRLGFAHSSMGDKLVDKKYFADQLTQLYIDHGFDVLVTAAAIGIDAVEFRCQLPASPAIRGVIASRLDDLEKPHLRPADLDQPNILLYPCQELPLNRKDDNGNDDSNDLDSSNYLDSRNDLRAEAIAHPATVGSSGTTVGPSGTAVSSGSGELISPDDLRFFGEDEDITEEFPAPTLNVPAIENDLLHFGQGKELVVGAAIRSGENGLFSVANCVALYNVMKVAIPEELAMVLVRHAIFGPERRRDWFQDKIAYYTETENSYFALRLLDNYPQLQRAHHGPFALQAYQALGSSTHQARLHELGLLLLLLRLRQLANKFPLYTEQQLLDALSDIDDFLWHETYRPCFEDLASWSVEDLALGFSRLCTVDSMESAGQLLGFDARAHGLRQAGRERFLARLATHIGRYLQSITSLGIPILFSHLGRQEDRLLVGPYAAPLDAAIARRHDVADLWQQRANAMDVPMEIYRDWTIVNNGFVDLRPHALATTAKAASGRDLTSGVHDFATSHELGLWLEGLELGSYFTTCGLSALLLRLQRLGDKVCRRRIELGTRETWKHLFQIDHRGRHIITPGLVETVRMHTEGLGKITGTEALWPRWGY